MFRTKLKTRLLEDGSIELIDPDIESIELLQIINPDFKIKHKELDNFAQPRFQVAKKLYLDIATNELLNIATEKLWDIHDSGVENLLRQESPMKIGISLLDIKIELTKRVLKECRLCGRECKVNRLLGERGICGVGVDSSVGEYFVHIAEEAPVNPSININLQGCGLRCRFCQRAELIEPDGNGIPLSPELWKDLSVEHAKSLSFVGGNPDESLYSILCFLAFAPEGFSKPIVWNSNGYASRIVYKLLHGIVDAYIPDMKFYSKKCSKSLAGCENYFEIFKEGISEMVTQDIPIFVRMLVIPGHLECCHFPLINYLSRYKQRVKLNILGQYYPDYIITEKDSLLNQRPTLQEVEYARNYAMRLGGSEWLITNEYERR